MKLTKSQLRIFDIIVLKNDYKYYNYSSECWSTGLTTEYSIRFYFKEENRFKSKEICKSFTSNKSFKDLFIKVCDFYLSQSL